MGTSILSVGGFLIRMVVGFDLCWFPWIFQFGFFFRKKLLILLSDSIEVSLNLMEFIGAILFLCFYIFFISQYLLS